MTSSERRDDGFSLIEVLVAGAVFSVVTLGAFEGVRLLAAAVPHVVAAGTSHAAVDRFVARLRSEARGATAVWSSSPDAGAAPDGCVQVDLFSTDAAGPHFRSYRRFPNHGAGDAVPPDAVQRLTATAALAPCDTRLAGTIVLTGLRGALGVTAIAAPSLAGRADSPFVGAVPDTPPAELGVLDAAGAPVRSGNGVLELTFATAGEARTVDLAAGVVPSAFTTVLRYTCTARCDVGHDASGAKTLTTCTVGWTPGWSTFVRWNDPVRAANGTLTFPGGWFIAGTFVMTYSGTRASDGGTDTFAASYPATNWDVTRDYAAYPPDRPGPDGTVSGGFAPWDVRPESPEAWLSDFSPYLARGEAVPLLAEQQRCDAVRAQGAAGGFYANG